MAGRIRSRACLALCGLGLRHAKAITNSTQPRWPYGQHFFRWQNVTLRLIQNDQEYREARKTLLNLVGHEPAPDAPQDEQLLALASAVERYEVQHLLNLPVGGRRTIVAKHGWNADGSYRFLRPEWERRRLRFALGLHTPLTRDDRHVLQRVVPVVMPVIEDAGKPYAVRIADVPQPLQDELREWWRMWCLPLFDPDGCGDCIYLWDWSAWLDGRVPDLP